MSGWYATSEDQAGALAAWADQQEVRYERYGVLPKVSELMYSGESAADYNAWVESKLGARVPVTADPIPARWAENLCTGTLPGRLEGTLAHFSYRYYSSETWSTATYTVVLARVLDGIRVARDMEARPDWGTVLSFEREYGDTYKEVEHNGLTWKVPVEEDENLVRHAVDGVPPDRYYSLREGMVVVAVEGIVDDREALYQHCLAAAAFADGLHRAARAQRLLGPGDELPPPRSTAYRDWAEAGAAQVQWRDPPPDLDSAATGYAEVASRDPAVERRARRGRRIILGLFAAIAVFGGAISGAAAAAAVGRGPGIATGAFGFAVLMLIGVVVARFVGRGAVSGEAQFRREAWGLAAFANGYARSRALTIEDPDEFRRRFPMPVPGSPQRVMRGELPGGVEGRVVLWRDRNVPERGFVNMAIVAAPPSPAQPPYVATPADGWLVVTEQVDRSGRTVARLDAVSTEAARLAKAAELS